MNITAAPPVSIADNIKRWLETNFPEGFNIFAYEFVYYWGLFDIDAVNGINTDGIGYELNKRVTTALAVDDNFLEGVDIDNLLEALGLNTRPTLTEFVFFYGSNLAPTDNDTVDTLHELELFNV